MPQPDVKLEQLSTTRYVKVWQPSAEKDDGGDPLPSTEIATLTITTDPEGRVTYVNVNPKRFQDFDIEPQELPDLESIVAALKEVFK